MVGNVRCLIQAAKLVGVPILVTEQIRKVCADTQPEVAEVLPAGQDRVRERCRRLLALAGICSSPEPVRRRQAVVCGIEAHACVNQMYVRAAGAGVSGAPAESGFRVFLVARLSHRLGEMMVGAVSSTVETVVSSVGADGGRPELK